MRSSYLPGSALGLKETNLTTEQASIGEAVNNTADPRASASVATPFARVDSL